METVAVVISEILGFLAIAWLLGFFVAWAIFRPIQLEYREEIEESEESMAYLKNIIRNQEKEITKLTREVQELSDPQHSTKEFLATQKRRQNKQKSKAREPQAKKGLTKKSEERILKEIEEALDKIN